MSKPKATKPVRHPSTLQGCTPIVVCQIYAAAEQEEIPEWEDDPHEPCQAYATFASMVLFSTNGFGHGAGLFLGEFGEGVLAMPARAKVDNAGQDEVELSEIHSSRPLSCL